MPPLSAEEESQTPGDTLWACTESMRVSACHEAIARLWAQHTGRIQADTKRGAAQTAIFALPARVDPEDLLIDNIITRTLAPSRKITAQCVKSAHEQIEDTRNNPNFHTAGLIWTRSVSPHNNL
eukprot:778391-Rhodomonas_salina.1